LLKGEDISELSSRKVNLDLLYTIAEIFVGNTFGQCAQYITIILFSFILTSSWVFSISGQSTSAAASPSLSTKTNLSNTITESGQQKNVAVSGKNVYVVWTEFTTPPPGHSDIFFKRSTDGGITFGPPKNLSHNPGDSSNPRIAVSGSNVYVVWEDNTTPITNGNFDILIVGSSNSGSTFSSPFNLSKNMGDSVNPQIAASGSTAYVVWQDNTFGTSKILFRKSGSPTMILSNNLKDSFHPRIAVSGTNVYVVWDSKVTPTNSDIFFNRSINSGSTFVIPAKDISNTPKGSSNPQIAVS
jgi:hypothetical protein